MAMARFGVGPPIRDSSIRDSSILIVTTEGPKNLPQACHQYSHLTPLSSSGGRGEII
jgi:hypothetical protein